MTQTVTLISTREIEERICKHGWWPRDSSRLQIGDKGEVTGDRIGYDGLFGVFFPRVGVTIYCNDSMVTYD